jgi:hypothetical protein
MALLAFAIGYVVFSRSFITPLEPGKHLPNYSHHVIAHPLVLGLALPSNPLSVREGIQWDDRIGIYLARQMVPNAVYLGAGYEEGLILYYLRLWMLYPAEMRSVYWQKLELAGFGMFAPIGGETFSEPVARALRRLPHPPRGWALLIVYAFWWTLAMVLGWRKRSAFWMLVAMICVSGLGMTLEATIIIPFFYMSYHSFLLVSLFFLYLLTAQLILDLIGAAVRRFIRVPPPHPA